MEKNKYSIQCVLQCAWNSEMTAMSARLFLFIFLSSRRSDVRLQNSIAIICNRKKQRQQQKVTA